MNVRQSIRCWDRFDAYLFDIDGTLLHCTDAVHYFAFCEALTSLAGRSLNLDGVTVHGNTDIGILRDALGLANVPDTCWRPRIAETRAAMCRFVRQREGDLCITVLPAVPATIEHLSARGATLGIVTGNLAGIGRLKLERCGLLSYFDFANYSDDFEYRSDVFRSGLAQAQALAGRNAAVCAVGDTPADIQAARANGMAVIAVATGIYPFEELAAEKPDYCVRSFEEFRPPLRLRPGASG